MAGSIRSVAQAFAVLRLLAETSPMSLSDIARGAGLSPSSCFNLLKTLLDEGAIERDARTRRYRLTRAWALAEALRDDAAQGLVERARPLMTKIAEANDAAVGLWKIISRERVRLSARAESKAGVRVAMADGQRQPLGGGAVGRALAAAQGVEAEEMSRRYEAVRWQTPLSREEYGAQVAEARQRGFALDEGATHRGICSVAVPILAVAPGFCLSASIFAGTRGPVEMAALAGELLALRAVLVPA